MNQSNNELKPMTPQQLELKIEELRRELFKLRLNAATAHVKSFPSQQRELRRAIARTLTHLRQNSLKAS